MTSMFNQINELWAFSLPRCDFNQWMQFYNTIFFAQAYNTLKSGLVLNFIMRNNEIRDENVSDKNIATATKKDDFFLFCCFLFNLTDCTRYD